MKRIFIVGTLCVLLAGGALLYYESHRATPTTSTMPATELPTKEITVGSTTITVELATDQAEDVQGLSGRTSLPEGSGLLMVFAEDGDWGIWMKDMLFPIDILFISQNGSVVSINAHVSPDTYNSTPPQVFYPPLAVRYVLELPAGYAAAHDIVPDSKFDLSSI